MSSTALMIRDALLTGSGSLLTPNTSLVYVCKGPRDKPYTSYPWAEVMLGNAETTRHFTGPVDYSMPVSIIVHGKTEEQTVLAMEQVTALYEGSSAVWIALKATSLGSDQLLDLAPVEGQGSYQYDGANNEHIGYIEMRLRYRKAVS